MSLNSREINEILSELDLENSFIQEVVQPSFDSIALYTYKPGQAKTIFISLASGACRIHETKRKIPKNPKPLRFMEMLKSRLKGARIRSVGQIGGERVIKIEAEKEGPLFIMPAAQEKFAKKSKKSAKNSAEIQADKTNQSGQTDEFGLQKYILYIRLWSNAGNIFLCSPDGKILDSFYRRPAKGEMTGETFTPPEIRESEKVWELREFPPEYEGLTFNEKIDKFYSEEAKATSIDSLLERAEKWFISHSTKIEGAIERLEEKRKSFLNAPQWKHQGDLILSYSGSIEAGKNFIEIEDFDDNSSIVRIKIDPKKSLAQNAGDYYEQYKKMTSGLEDLERDIERSKRELESLKAQYKKMTDEKNPVKLEQLLRKSSTPKQQEKNPRPGLSYEFSGWTILVGRDANENDTLLRRYVKGPDTWFHTRDYAGGYVFVKNRPGKTIPLEIMLAAGNLAVFYSKARKNGQADLYYTQVKHLRRAKNGPKGLVLPTNEKNLHIKLDEALLRKIEDENF